MDLDYPRANVGLSATATHTNPGTTGTAVVGAASQSISLPEAEWAVSFEWITSTAATLTLADWSLSGAAWSDGTRQVETATAAGVITGAGNASVVVTAAGMTGSPKTILVPVANGDTAATWAGKVRTALAADTAVAAMFDVSGSSTSIVLTRKAVDTFTMAGAVYEVRAANDSTLNISLDNGTCTGITTAATSTNTTAGVKSAGSAIYRTTGDFQGNALSTAATKQLFGVLVEVLGVTSPVAGNSIGLGAGPIAAFNFTNAGARCLLVDPSGLTTSHSSISSYVGTWAGLGEADSVAHVRITLLGKDA